MDKKILLKIKDLDLSYVLENKEKNKIFDKFNLSIYENERLVILGESGSGKSTLANLLMGILPKNTEISSGTLEIDGKIIDLTDKNSMKDLGPDLGFSLIFQDASLALNPSRNIFHQFKSLIKLKKIDLDGSIYEYASDLLRKVGFDNPDKILKSKAKSLSGGMCQRVCIALSLAMEARMIIGDEPTSALDLISSNQVIDTLKSIENMTSFVIIHDLDVARSLADRIIVLREGKIIEENDEDIIKHPKEAYTKSLVKSYLDLKGSTKSQEQGAGENILEIKSLTKNYGGQQVLDNLDLKVKEGEILGILGRSGSGKSTLARIIMGLDQADQGQMIFQEARASLNPYQSCLGQPKKY